MASKKTKLKPCPFCGGKALVEKGEFYSRGCCSNYDKYLVGCKGWIGGRMCPSNRSRQSWDLGFDTREDAEAAWNTRNAETAE